MERGKGKMKEGGLTVFVKSIKLTGIFKGFHLAFLAISLISPALFSATPKHVYHVSVTQMQFNPALKSFEVSIRIFTDDLEKALSENNGKARFTIKDNDRNDLFVERLIRKSFILTDSRKTPVLINYVGKEQEEDATWIYLEIPFQGSISGCKLQNSTLMDVFDDQVNMTNVKSSSEKRTFLFKKGQTIHFL